MSVTPGNVQTGLHLFARLFPVTPLNNLTPLCLEELQSKYKSRDRWARILGYTLIVALGVAYYFGLNWIANWHYREFQNGAFLIRPLPVEFIVFALFMSLTSATSIAIVLFRWAVGRRECDIYVAYTSIRSSPSGPIDSAKLSFWFFWLGFIPTAGGAALQIDSYTAFTDRAVIYNPLLSLGSRVEYPYSTVRGVYVVRYYRARFENTDDPFLVMNIDNGPRWETTPGMSGLSLERQREIMRFVAGRSGRRSGEVAFVENIPP